MASKSTYASIAQSLANSASPPESPSHTATRSPWPRAVSSSAARPIWTRASSVRSHSPSSLPLHTRAARLLDSYIRKGLRLFRRLTLLQKIALILLALVGAVVSLLFVIFNEAIFEWMEPLAEQWKTVTGGWIVLWLLICITGFPPLVGYSTLVTLAGFVYGMKGWFIASTANVVGSLASFMVCRYYFRDFSTRLAESDPRFSAFSLVIAHDGLPLMVAIRLCPLPYSLSNAGLSTIRTIKPLSFALATAGATPKLLLHVFVGERLAVIARSGGTMDAKTKAINYAGIVVGLVIGAATGWIIYRRTVARAQVLQAEERRKELARGEGRFAAQLGAGGGAAPSAGLQHPDAFMDDEGGGAGGLLDTEGRDEIDFLDGNYADEPRHEDEESAVMKDEGKKERRSAVLGGLDEDLDNDADVYEDEEQEGVINMRSSVRL